jgi:hypothetical protein
MPLLSELNFEKSFEQAVDLASTLSRLGHQQFVLTGIFVEVDHGDALVSLLDDLLVPVEVGEGHYVGEVRVVKLFGRNVAKQSTECHKFHVFSF